MYTSTEIRTLQSQLKRLSNIPDRDLKHAAYRQIATQMVARLKPDVDVANPIYDQMTAAGTYQATTVPKTDRMTNTLTAIHNTIDQHSPADKIAVTKDALRNKYTALAIAKLETKIKMLEASRTTIGPTHNKRITAECDDLKNQIQNLQGQLVDQSHLNPTDAESVENDILNNIPSDKIDLLANEQARASIIAGRRGLMLHDRMKFAHDALSKHVERIHQSELDSSDPNYQAYTANDYDNLEMTLNTSLSQLRAPEVENPSEWIELANTPTLAKEAHFNQLLANLPDFDLRRDVDEITRLGLNDTEIPVALTELQLLCQQLNSQANALNELRQTLHNSYSTPDEKTTAVKSLETGITKFQQSYIAYNQFLRQHSQGVLKAVNKDKMQELLTANNAIMYQLEICIRRIARRYETSLANTVMTWFHDLNQAAKRMTGSIDTTTPHTGWSITGDSEYRVEHNPNYLSQNHNLTGSTKFQLGRKTSGILRKRCNELHQTLELPVNPPNSNDPKAAGFSVRQLAIEVFGHDGAQALLRTLPNGNVVVKWRNNQEGEAWINALKSRNDAYLKWKKEQAPEYTLSGDAPAPPAGDEGYAHTPPGSPPPEPRDTEASHSETPRPT